MTTTANQGQTITTYVNCESAPLISIEKKGMTMEDMMQILKPDYKFRTCGQPIDEFYKEKEKVLRKNLEASLADYRDFISKNTGWKS